MKSEKDTYGMELYANFLGKKAPEIIERDDNYIDVGFEYAQYYFSPFKRWDVKERKAIKYAKGKVLDIGCGAGRVALYLQKKGHKVVGIDNSPLAVKVSRLRGAKTAKVMSISEIGKFSTGEFDTIIMFGHNFGLFSNYTKAKTLLKKLYRITSEKAMILATTRDPYKTKDPLDIAYDKANVKKGRMYGQIKIRVRFANSIGDWFDYLFVSKKEMKEILNGTGWKAKRFIFDKPHSYAVVIQKEA